MINENFGILLHKVFHYENYIPVLIKLLECIG